MCVCVCVWVKRGQRAALSFPDFYDTLRIAPGAAAATVQLSVIWRLGGKFVASLLATSYSPDVFIRGRPWSWSGSWDRLMTESSQDIFQFDFIVQKKLHDDDDDDEEKACFVCFATQKKREAVSGTLVSCNQ